MCIMSMVHDHYWDKLKKLPSNSIPDIQVVPVPYPALTPEEVKEIKEFIADFKRDKQKAKDLDEVLEQPDCADPEKVKLEEQITALEKQLEELKSQRKKPVIKGVKANSTVAMKIFTRKKGKK